MKFKSEIEYTAAVEAQEFASTVKLKEFEVLAQKIHFCQFESTHLKEAKFYLDQAYTAAKHHNDKMIAEAQKMKSEAFKHANIEGYAV